MFIKFIGHLYVACVPRYCPHCAKSGLKTKVKKFKLDPTKDDLTIMCKNAEVTFILMS